MESNAWRPLLVMPALVAGIHDFPSPTRCKQVVDRRVKPGDDDLIGRKLNVGNRVLGHG